MGERTVKTTDEVKKPFAERTKWEGSRVRVLTLDMKPVGEGVLEYVNIDALPPAQREEFRTSGNFVWTRVHMDDGSKLFAFDHYIQFLDDDSPMPYRAKEAAPKPDPSKPKWRRGAKQTENETEAPSKTEPAKGVKLSIAQLDAWASRREKP